MWLGLFFVLANFLLLAWSSLADGDLLHHAQISPSEYAQENLSEPFAVSSAGVMRLKITAPVRNSWATLDLALVNGKNEVVAESGGEVSYYEGSEGGERWSEGSQSQDVFFKAPPAGTYRLLLRGSNGVQAAARPGKNGLSSTPNAGPSIKVDLFQGQVLSRYFLFALGAAAILPLFLFMRRRLFEQRRWISVTEDDDDETDWDDFD